MYGQLHEPEAPPAWYKAGDSVGSSGQAVVDDAVGLVATRHPSLAVRGVVVEWPAAMVLTSASRTAELLVVGARGMGGFGELLLGSIGDQCIQYAHCPVVVVHGESDDPAFESASPRIVVGVDGSPGSVRALRWALDEARTLSASVDAVFAWHYPAYYAAVVGPAKRFQVAAEAMVAKAVESAADWAPRASFRAASVARRLFPPCSTHLGEPTSSSWDRRVTAVSVKPCWARSLIRAPATPPARSPSYAHGSPKRTPKPGPTCGPASPPSTRSPLPLRWGCRAGDRRGR